MCSPASSARCWGGCGASERDPAQRLAHDDSLLHKHLAEIVVTAVNLHAAAARLGAAELGENGFTAKDLLEYLPKAIVNLA